MTKKPGNGHYALLSTKLYLDCHSLSFGSVCLFCSELDGQHEPAETCFENQLEDPICYATQEKHLAGLST